MSNKKFIPLNIEDADQFHIAEYGYYCQYVIKDGEMPATFEQWQIEKNNEE